MPTARIAPLMLSLDFTNLASKARRKLHFGADWLHMDIMLVYVHLVELIFSISLNNFLPKKKNLLGFMLVYLQDGRFVANLTIGAPVIQSLRKHTKAYLDCHLMVTNPIDYVEPFGKAGASGFAFHVEVSKDNWQELVEQIMSKGMRPGVALRPGTPIEDVYPLLDGENPVEMVLVMTVEPGFGSCQKQWIRCINTVCTLRKKYPSLDIEVDGGLGPSAIDVVASAGANCIVAGSSVLGASEPARVISLLRKSVEEADKGKIFA
ncbi:Ribulose-phosphate 3-epimerase, cytoplasmic isoform [Camellia lanceoleosa]|uniref:Ribulose-phosphate 3-epimerase, cytoplasmic isoform n=1 Tax=Camellia lanceoleosa TaxID=1840588 RepID=A0ACC0HX62_9ERIC|nr:Ribulose-phosphate 3-epimerase, cytoplasmic isoform [Camellia lanceoleosa]